MKERERKVIIYIYLVKRYVGSTRFLRHSVRSFVLFNGNISSFRRWEKEKRRNSDIEVDVALHCNVFFFFLFYSNSSVFVTVFR